MDRWTHTYSEMGSRDKKTGKLKYYNVVRTNTNSFTCECPAAMYRPFSECKHTKRLRQKLGI